MDTIETLRTFVRVVETGSLTAVAREMNAGQSTISRQIAQLEAHFGLRLLHRTTRHLSLTDDGRGLHDHARRLLGLVEGMEACLGQHKSSPAGRVRVAIPAALGLLLMGRLPALTARYPGLSVELIMEEHAGAMIEERFDLSVRAGEVTNASLIMRRLGALVRIAVAAPAYLARRGSPRDHNDLIRHDCIMRRGGSEWRLAGPDGSVGVVVRGAVSTNSHEAAHGAALGGLGIALLPDYLVIEDIRAGRLRRVLPEYTSEDLSVCVVNPSRRYLPPRTRVVIDFLIEEVGRLNSRWNAHVTPLSAPGNEVRPRERAFFALAA